MENTNKISSKQLVEYVKATANRRTRIIQDIIEPQVYIMDRYNEVDRAISSFLESNATDPTALNELDKRVQDRKIRNDNHEKRLLDTLDAIEMAKHINLKNLPANSVITALPKSMPRLNVGGMAISVRPTNLIISKQDGTIKSGAIIPYISKSRPLVDEDALYLSTLLHWYCEKTFGKENAFKPELCLAIDVFEQKIISAPKRQKMRRRTLENCCWEIHDRIPAMRSRITREVKISTKSA